MVLYSMRQVIKHRELCRNRVIRLLNQWHHDAEGWLLLATLEEQDAALAKLRELLTEDIAGIGWNEMLRYYDI